MKILIISGGHVDIDFAWEYLQLDKCTDGDVVNEATGALATHIPGFDMIIAADAGMNPCMRLGITPNLIIGDFDSTSSEAKDYFMEVCPDIFFTFPVRKDETDTHLAVIKAIELGADSFEILGGTGTRLDHVLGNINVLKFAYDHGANGIITDKTNRIRLIDGHIAMKKSEKFGKYVSLIPFASDVKGIRLTGFSYNAENLTMEAGSTLGISNEIEDDIAEITFDSGLLLVMESRD